MRDLLVCVACVLCAGCFFDVDESVYNLDFAVWDWPLGESQEEAPDASGCSQASKSEGGPDDNDIDGVLYSYGDTTQGWLFEIVAAPELDQLVLELREGTEVLDSITWAYETDLGAAGTLSGANDYKNVHAEIQYIEECP